MYLIKHAGFVACYYGDILMEVHCTRQLLDEFIEPSVSINSGRRAN